MKGSLQLFVMLTALGLAVPNMLWAQESSEGQTTLKVDEVKPKKKNDIDQEITNARMRADSGSKSKFSMSLNMNYRAGSIQKPFAKERPNLYGDPIPQVVQLTGDIGARYRVSKRQSVSGGTGIGIVQPFHEPSGDQSSYNDKFEINTPFVSWTYASRFMGIQSVSSLSTSFTTIPRYREIGDVMSVSASTALLKDIGTTGIQVGLAPGISFTYYDKSASDFGSRQVDYYLTAIPFAEYVINDTFSARTVFGTMMFRRVRSEGSWDLERSGRYQSLGLGISPTRDIYIYPNVQWSWEGVSPRKGPSFERTNVAINTTINLF
jgi:hypothetical protein